MLRRVVVVLVVLLLALQLWPVERSNPPVDPSEALQGPPEVVAVLRESCYDCHSHETRWPWYAWVAPVSLQVAHDVEEARGELNFSIWNTYSETRREMLREDCWEEASIGEMPLESYRFMHSEAELTDDDLETLRAWAEGD